MHRKILTENHNYVGVIMRLPNFNARAMNKASIAFCILQAIMIPVLIGVVGAAMAQPLKALGGSRFLFALVSAV